MLFAIFLWLIAETQCYFEDGTMDNRPTRPGQKPTRETIQEKVKRLKGATMHRELSQTDYYNNKVGGGWNVVDGYQDTATRQPVN